MSLRCAVVGVGRFGRFYAQKYVHLEETELVAVCDLDKGVGETCAKECQTLYVEDYRELLGLVEAVTVATHTASHYEVARFFLENGVHVYVEKPITQTYWEGRELCELAEKNNLKLQVNHIERLNPALLFAREKIKRIYFIECQRLSLMGRMVVDMNVISDLMIHDLDIILSLVDSEVVDVSAEGGGILSSGTIDISSARIEFASGAAANVTASRISPAPQRTIRVFHSEGYLSVDLQSGEVCCTNQRLFSQGLKVWNMGKKDMLMEGVRLFVAAVQGRGECFILARESLAALKLAEQITKRAQSHYSRWQGLGSKSVDV